MLYLILEDKNIFRIWPDLSEYIKDIDKHYTHINDNADKENETIISLLRSINKEFWQSVIYYTHTPRTKQLRILKSRMDDVITKFKYKVKRFRKNFACLIPRLQRRFSSDPQKMMASGYYGRQMTEEEQEVKKQAKLEVAQSRNNQDPLLALFHKQELDYDYEYDSMGKSNFHYRPK